MSQDATSFTNVAPYYDELMKAVPYRMWVGYYLLLLSQQEARPKTILDVCCGTGTMCEMLHREGYRMAGVDLSPGMIAAAREKATAKKLDIRYEVGDAAEFDMGDRYDAALSFFDSLNNILDPERFESALRRVYAHLRPGGSFVFDLNTAFAFEQSMFDQTDMRAGTRLKYRWVGNYDSEDRIITVNMRFWYEGEEFTEVHRQRAYDHQDVLEMLDRIGFTNVEAYHSYTLNPPRPKSDRIHYTARRP